MNSITTISSVSIIALALGCTTARAETGVANGAVPAGQAQPAPTTSAGFQAPASDAAAGADSAQPEIVVRGIRTSLAKAADIKRTSSQVVDSIVAEDIGKFPDPTVAAALQRIPGIQVSIANTDNEIAGVIIRGLADIQTTVNGREIFTGGGRSFAFQDLPAEALARVDVFKSNSAEMIEGGVAGSVDMQLHRPFDFKQGLTVSGLAQGADDTTVNRINPKIGLLVSDRWDTGIGEFGALVDLSYSRNVYNRANPFNDNLRAMLVPGIAGADGIVIPAAETAENSTGEYQRPQANASLQWKPSSDLQFYADGLFAGYRTKRADDFNLYDTSSAKSLSNIVTNNNCQDYLVGSNGFYDPNGSLEHLCTVKSFDANNLFALNKDEAHHSTTNTWLFAIGGKYDHDALHLDFDISDQRSKTRDRYFILVTGKPITSISAQTDVHGQPVTTAAGTPLASPDDMRFTYGLDEGASVNVSKQFAATVNGHYDLPGWLHSIHFGGRFADRNVTSQAYALSAAAPGGSYVTPVAGQGLPTDFYGIAPGIPGVDNGAPYLVPSRSSLLDPSVEDILRGLYGLPLGTPDYQPERGFHATERNFAGYLQTLYDIPIGGAISLDGVVGARLTRTDRSIAGAGYFTDASGAATLQTVNRHTSDTDILPNASARLRFGDGLQARFNYSKTLTRPDFGSLNPGLNYTLSTNQYILSTGSSGNPDLKPEKADAFDATLEYYFKKGSYISVGGYYKKIKNRVTSSSDVETINGVDFTVFKPRNIGSATLKGVEVSGQTFFDFLPGAAAGLGAFANFTLADSKVTTPGDTLNGYPLIGVSKYSYNVGLIYEKYGLSTRVVYSYRSGYNDGDVTPGQDVRPVTDPVYFEREHPLGRLDFSINYDLTHNITLTVDGGNVTHAKTKSYRSDNGAVLLPRATSYDAVTYTGGVRFTF